MLLFTKNTLNVLREQMVATASDFFGVEDFPVKMMYPVLTEYGSKIKRTAQEKPMGSKGDKVCGRFMTVKYRNQFGV